MNKEELLIQNGDLTTRLQLAHDADEKIRREFAKVFHWYEKPSPYGYDRENRKTIVPSWMQIFTEVGKLLAARTFYDLEGNISEHEELIRQIRKQLDGLQEN